MSKNLEKLSLPRLTVLELGQHIKTTWEGIKQLDEGIITDENLINYMDRTESQLGDYDRAMIQQVKSDETVKIVKADKERDNALTAMFRMLKVHEFSSDPTKQEAIASLNSLFNTYKRIQKWNFEEETSGIDNLIEDLEGAKNEHVVTLNMGAFVTGVKTTNNNFRTLFANRINETASKEVFDLKMMRAEMRTTYEDMCNYVFLMAKALETDQFNKSLAVINATRKYYSDMLARRNHKNTTTETPPV